jgi:hypothetical protein
VGKLSRYYDLEGQPIELEQWLVLFEGEDEDWRIGFTGPFYGRTVSTVWLGLDHNFAGYGPPLIFESMTFAASDPLVDNDWARYTNEAQAEYGHRDMVRRNLHRAEHRLAAVAGMAAVAAGWLSLAAAL